MGSAVFSECGKYRWRLDRDLGRNGPIVCLPGVNPSSAGAEVNDATIRKDIGFGERHGWGRLIKVNKFAFISTDIKGLRSASDPVGSENNRYLEEAFREADIIVGCWGPLGKLPMDLRKRWRTVVAIAENLGKPIHCLGTAQDGQPRHTLMLSYDTPLTVWQRPR